MLKCALCGKTRFTENGVCDECLNETMDDDPGEEDENVSEREHPQAKNN